MLGPAEFDAGGGQLWPRGRAAPSNQNPFSDFFVHSTKNTDLNAGASIGRARQRCHLDQVCPVDSTY